LSYFPLARTEHARAGDKDHTGRRSRARTRIRIRRAAVVIVGRAHDCDIPTPDGEENLVVSRHHCLLEIDPPTVRVLISAAPTGPTSMA
jgi:pSer/pThr/pTyr-binding forkhead associated (FHA) protein